MSSDSIFSEVLAYAQQGLVYVEEGNKDVAKYMWQMGTDLLETVKDNDTSNKLRQDAVNVLDLLKNKLEGDEKIEMDFRETVDAQLLFWLPEGVQLVTIEKSTTTSPTPSTSLAIFTVEKTKKAKSLYPNLTDATLPKAIIQVGPWAYPLVPEQSQIMKNEMGVYVVPNPTEISPDMCVGILLPRDLDKKLEEDFVKVLRWFATVKESDIVENMTSEQRQRTSQKIASFLQESGQKFAFRVQKAADSAGEFMNARGEKFRAGMGPNEKPTNINPVIKYGVLVGYKGSKAFAKVTRAILDKVGEIGVNIGRRVANSASGDTGSGRLVSGSANVIGGGIAGVSLAWIALEDASRQLFRSFATEAVETVKVRYGEAASETSYHALHGIGHTTLSAFQLWDLGPRSIAGRMARHAGIQVVQDLASNTSASKLSDVEKPVTKKKKQ